MIWMEQYTDKRLRELQQDVIFRLSDALYYKRRVMPYEHNGSSHFIVSNFFGTVVLRRSFW